MILIVCRVKRMRKIIVFGALAALCVLFFSFGKKAVTSSLNPKDLDKISMAPPATEKTMRHYDGIGYIMATDYSEQVPAAIAGLVSLQCWAATVSPQIRVVEPYLLEGSKLGINLRDQEDLVSLGAVLDANSRDELVREKGYVSLVDFDSFIGFAPEDLILVSTCSVSGYPSICSLQNSTFYEAAMAFAQENGFHVVRHVHLLNQAYTAKELIY